MALKDIAISTAQFLLPKSTERYLGIAPPEPVKPLPPTNVFDPSLFRAEIAGSIQDNIKAGVLDSTQIKANVKAQVQQKIDEGFLRKVLPPSPPSISGFIHNAERNTSEIVDGFGTLLGMGIKATLHPIDTMQNLGGFTAKMIASPQYRDSVKATYVDPIINDYKEYRHPLTKLYEDPLSVVLDVTALFSLGGTALVKSGAKVSETAAKETATASAVRDARTAVQSARTPEDMRVAAEALQKAKAVNAAAAPATDSLAFKTGKAMETVGGKLTDVSHFASTKNLSAATKGVIRAMPGGDEIIKNWDIAAQTRKALQKEQASFLASRNRVINDINTKVGKLTKEEVAVLPRVAEGMAMAPSGASTHFYEALGLMRALAKDQERFGLKIGSLSRDIVERRKWAPLAKWAEKNGLVPPKEALVHPLAEQAKKFKSAEEFMKGQGEPMYHGTPTKGLTELKSGAETGTGQKINVPYITKEKATAEQYILDRNIDDKGLLQKREAVQSEYEATQSGASLNALEKIDSQIQTLINKQKTGEVLTVSFSGRSINPFSSAGRNEVINILKTADKSSLTQKEQRIVSNILGNDSTEFLTSKVIDESPNIRKVLSDNGIHGLEYPHSALPYSGGVEGTQIAVLDKTKLNTRSQLTDIWTEATKKEAKASEKFGTSFDNLTGNELYAQIENLKRQFPDADPVYMRHFFADKPKNFFNFFLNTRPVKSFKPGFLKKYTGAEGYIGESANVTKEELINILERQSAENIKWQRNIGLIESVKNHPLTKPLSKGALVDPGYRVFAPDGMIRFYKGTIDFAKELEKKIGANSDVWTAFEDTVKAAFPEGKTYLGVTKAKIYQVPEAMAKELEKNVASTNPWVKIFYDKPLDAFRFTALSLFPRWQMNNIVGNAVFSTIKGDVFNPKAFTNYMRLRKMDGIFPDELFGGVHRVEQTTSGRLGAAADLPLVKSTIAMHDKLLDTRIIGQMVRVTEGMMSATVSPIIKLGNWSFKMNGAVDDMFKGVSYINSALKLERKNFLTRMVTSFDDSLKALESVKKNPKALDKIVEDVHSWYYHGLNLTDFERRTVRRVIPFYSWMRWSTLYAYRVATEAPVRADIIAHMANDFYMFTGQDKLPDYLKGAVPMGTDADGTAIYLQTRGTNPLSFIGDLMQKGLAEAALAGAAPAVKTFAEQATGKDTFLGKPFTKEGITQMFNGDLYKVDPDTGKVVKIDEKIKPALLENLLRNYLPQYLMLEAVLSGGQRRYTSEGLVTILGDLFKDPKQRDAIIKDVITMQGAEKTTVKKELLKAVGINLQEVTPLDRVKRQQAINSATSALLNKEVPILNQNFKALLKQRIMDEVAKGTPKDKIQEEIKVWIGINIDKLKKLK